MIMNCNDIKSVDFCRNWAYFFHQLIIKKIMKYRDTYQRICSKQQIQTIPVMTYQMSNPSFPYNNVFYSSKKLQNMNCILEESPQMGGLYIGDVISTVKPGILQKSNIKAILACNQTPYNSRRDLNIEKKFIDCYDTLDFPIKEYFVEAHQFIQKHRRNKNNVLVHCHAGVSRSGAIVISYLMKKQNWSAIDALQFVRKKRQRVKPNEGFWKQLVQYEKQILRYEQKQKTNQVKKIESKIQVVNPQVNQQVKGLDDITQALTNYSFTDSKKTTKSYHISGSDLQQKYFTPVRYSKAKPQTYMSSNQYSRNKATSNYLDYSQTKNYVIPQANSSYQNTSKYFAPSSNYNKNQNNSLLINENNGYRNQTYDLKSDRLDYQPTSKTMYLYNQQNTGQPYLNRQQIANYYNSYRRNSVMVIPQSYILRR